MSINNFVTNSFISSLTENLKGNNSINNKNSAISIVIQRIYSIFLSGGVFIKK